MTPFNIPLRIVLYQEDGDWIAHCLEFDLIGHGRSRQEAVNCLAEATRLQIEEFIKFQNPKNLFSPADGKLFEMFAAGKHIRILAEVSLTPTDSVVIPDSETREYSDTRDLATFPDHDSLQPV